MDLGPIRRRHVAVSALYLAGVGGAYFAFNTAAQDAAHHPDLGHHLELALQALLAVIGLFAPVLIMLRGLMGKRENAARGDIVRRIRSVEHRVRKLAEKLGVDMDDVRDEEA